MERRRLKQSESEACPAELPAPEDLTIEWVEVTFGAEKFQPTSFHFIDLGPFSVRGKVKPGETVEQAVTRLNVQLEAAAAAEFERKIKAYRERVRQSDAAFGR